MITAEGTAPGPRSQLAAIVRERPWPLVVGGAMVVWWALLFATVRSELVNFRFARFDLGNMVQAVWSTAHGRPLEITTATGDQVVRLTAHVDPILALLAPLWLVAPTPLTLAGVQIAAVALGALPVFWLGRRHLQSEKAAALLALAYLAYPWLAWTALDAFHPVTLAIPLFLYGIWFLDSGRVWAFAVCAVLVAATGELMGVSIAALGVWYWLARGRRRAGLAIAVGGLAWTVLALKVIVPSFSDGDSAFYGYYYTVGGSPEGVIRTAVSDPGTILSALFSTRDVAFLVWLVGPLAGMFLLAPGLAAVALPQLAANALSDLTYATDPRFHYIGAVLPFLVAASVLGIAKLPRAHRVPAAALGLGLCAFFAAAVGPWQAVPGWRSVGFKTVYPAEHVTALREAVALVPDDASVSTTNKLGSYLSSRRYLFSVPMLGHGDVRAEWLAVDTWDPLIPDGAVYFKTWRQPRFRVFIRAVEQSGRWEKVYERSGVFVFRRATPSG